MLTVRHFISFDFTTPRQRQVNERRSCHCPRMGTKMPLAGCAFVASGGRACPDEDIRALIAYLIEPYDWEELKEE